MTKEKQPDEKYRPSCREELLKFLLIFVVTEFFVLACLAALTIGVSK